MTNKMVSNKEVKNYWEHRALNDKSVQSTTNDIFLRSIEQRVLLEKIGALEAGNVLDVGCGDGRTTSYLAERLEKLKFSGIDYSDAMISNAKELNSNLKNVRFSCVDAGSARATEIGVRGAIDIVFSTRCLINVIEDRARNNALSFIHEALAPDGTYLMIENFLEGHNKFNEIRRRFDLPEISIRNHNKFFSMDSLEREIAGRFAVEEVVNISSTYYLATRIIYASVCKSKGIEPDYGDINHKLAAELPFAGDFGPVNLVVLRRI